MSADKLSHLHILLSLLFEESTVTEETIAIHIVLNIVDSKLKEYREKGGN